MANELTHPRWTEIWDKGLEPGELFDANSITPLLGNLIKDGKIPNGRALVPGCGRGYDVTALATKDRYVLGLDIAENAVKAAKQRLALVAVIRPGRVSGAVLSTQSAHLVSFHHICDEKHRALLLGEDDVVAVV